MAGTRAGGLKAAQTNIEKHGPNFYRKIASMSKGIKRPGSGFASNRELAREAGRLGGMKSRRGPAKETV